MNNPTPPVTKTKKTRRGLGSRKKAAERFISKRNEFVSTAIDHLSQLAMSDDVDVAYESFMRMSTLRHQITHNLNFDDDVKEAVASRVRTVIVQSNVSPVGSVITLPEPVYHDQVAVPVENVLQQTFNDVDEGFSDDDIYHSEELADYQAIIQDSSSDADHDSIAPLSWAEEVDKCLPIRVEEQADLSSYLQLSKEAIKKQARQLQVYTTSCAVINVNQRTSNVLVKVPDDYYIPYWFQRRYKFRPIRFTRSIEEFREFMGMKIYVEHHSREIGTHANIYIKYHHPGQVIFSIDKIPMINPEYRIIQVDALRG